MKKPITAAAAALCLIAAGAVVGVSLGRDSNEAAPAIASTTSSVEHGRYLVKITSCNDCHTPGYNESGGTLPPSEWLTGSSTGFSGPWGTSYPPNLRLTVQRMSEDEWLTFARARRLPPMPCSRLRP